MNPLPSLTWNKTMKGTLTLALTCCLTAIETATFSASAFAEPGGKISFSFKDAEFDAVLKDYSKATGQKFVVDPSIHAKVTIINQEPVSKEEAFNELSLALAANGVGISNREQIMYVSPARMIQRNLIPVTTELPPLQPERMHTLVLNLKHASSEEIMKQLRMLSSRDGEITAYTPRNQIIVTDWTSSLYRVASIMKEVDQPAVDVQGGNGGACSGALGTTAAPVLAPASSDSQATVKSGVKPGPGKKSRKAPSTAR